MLLGLSSVSCPIGWLEVFIEGFAVVESNDMVEGRLADLLVRLAKDRFPEVECFEGVAASEFVLTRIVGFQLEYTVRGVHGFKSVYTVNFDDWFVSWSYFMNLFYTAGVELCGAFISHGGPSIWFDVQGVECKKGWLCKVEEDSDVERIVSMLDVEDEVWLALKGFNARMLTA